MIIRPEAADDHAVISEVNRAAFGGPLEAMLVERLRSDGLIVASLVAEESGLITGHILFSNIKLETPGGDVIVVASLAPMAVLPSRQRRGIGSMLVHAGIEACTKAREKAVLVVGHLDYYPRFGFSHALVSRLENPFAANEAFMGLELVQGSLTGIAGRVVYPEAFRVFS